ncbi:hypothetical protein MHBO_003666 [Bonamia ostreae]|uniref:Uncharacterized protein n=1 Tax=Bonamia ostreae TaxID=126728 RepID=A0ABV2AR53_9EUKA
MFVLQKFLNQHITKRHAEAAKTFLSKEEQNDFFQNFMNDKDHFQLEKVESLIPGDTSSRYSRNENSRHRNSRNGFNGRRGSRFNSRRGVRFKRRSYVDFDKPPCEEEVHNDYGFSSEAKFLFKF